MKVKEKRELKPSEKAVIWIAIFACILLVAVTCIQYYFDNIKDDSKKVTDKKDKKDNNEDVEPIDNETLTVNNKAVNYEKLISEINKDGVKARITKCDCSEVYDETDSDKAKCKTYQLEIKDVEKIVNKMASTKKYEEVATGRICAEYAVEVIDENKDTILTAFEADDPQYLLAGIKGEGFAFEFAKEDIRNFLKKYVNENYEVDERISSYEVEKMNVDLLAKYDSIKLKKVNKVSDIYIVAFEYMNKTDDAYDLVLYAINKKGKVLWYEKSKEECSKDNNKECLPTVGHHFTQEFGYKDSKYKINGKKITFVSEASTQDPSWSACSMANKDDYFIAEYEIDYLGNNKFSDLKVKQSITAKEYIKNNNIDCSEN